MQEQTQTQGLCNFHSQVCLHHKTTYTRHHTGQVAQTKPVPNTNRNQTGRNMRPRCHGSAMTTLAERGSWVTLGTGKKPQRGPLAWLPGSLCTSRCPALKHLTCCTLELGLHCVAPRTRRLWEVHLLSAAGSVSGAAL